MKCPECENEMIHDPKIRRYVCQVCGISLTKTEIEDQWDDIYHEEEDPEEKKRREREEYKNWYFKRKK